VLKLEKKAAFISSDGQTYCNRHYGDNDYALVCLGVPLAPLFLMLMYFGYLVLFI